MKTARIIILFMATALAGASASSPEELAASAALTNPEWKFYSSQIAALPVPLKADSPVIGQPLEFASRAEMRAAVLGLDAGLAKLYLAEFREVLESDVRLKAMEYAASSRASAVAADLAERISALVKMLDERPAAGVEALVERRILEGAAIPFVTQAAGFKVRAEILKNEINGLLGRDGGEHLDVSMEDALPAEAGEDAPGSPLILDIRKAQLDRGIGAPGAGVDLEDFEIGGWFTRDGLGAIEPASGLMRPGAAAGETVEARRTRLLDDARRKFDQARSRRKLALDAAIKVAHSIPAELVENLRAASDLAERQYRVGALGVNLLIEIHKEYLNALQSRNEAILQAWRNYFDLRLLDLETIETKLRSPLPSSSPPRTPRASLD